MNFFAGIFSAYLLGTIPFGLLTGFWVKKVDIRLHGSGNLGATNVFRVIGKKWGITVLILDALKGYLGVFLMQSFFVPQASMEQRVAAAVCCILGHTFPVWLRFKGGKGVATSLGVFIALAPGVTLCTFGLFTAIFMFSRIISLSSIVSAVSFPIIIFVYYRGKSEMSALFPVSLLLAVFILFTHRSNIKRILRGEEKRLI